MIITKHGKTFLKLTFADKIIGLNPISKNSKEKTTKFGADIAISSLNHSDFNGFEMMSSAGKKPFIIKGAGEYEISDIFIKGFALKERFMGEDKIISSYTILLNGINIVLFGPLTSTTEFSNEAFEEFAQGEIFIIPIGGKNALTPKEASKFIKQFSPKMIIPILYESTAEIEEFSANLGIEGKKLEKLSIKKRDLPEDKSELIILKNI